MSAYIVDKATIDALITICIALDRADDGSNEPPDCSQGLVKYDRLGALLWRENFRSVNSRYNEKKRAPSYVFEALPIARTVTPKIASRALGALRGFCYQACEHKTWLNSRANRWCSVLEARLGRIAPWAPSRYTTPAWERRPVVEGWTVEASERDTALIDPDATRVDGGFRGGANDTRHASQRQIEAKRCEHGVPFPDDTGHPACDQCTREEAEWEARAS